MILSQDRWNLIYDEKKGHSEDYGDFDELLFSQLLDGRDAFWKLIENENVPMAVRMIQMLSMGHHLQRNINAGQLFGLENIYDHYLSEGAADRMCAYLKDRWEKPGSRYHVMKEMFACLHKLEVLSADWPKKVRHYEKVLFGGGRKQYEALHQYRMSDKIAEQLLSYFIYVYFAGAVYDGMPYSKVKLAVISIMLIEDMVCAKAAEKGCSCGMGTGSWGARTVLGSGQRRDICAKEVKAAGKSASAQPTGGGISLSERIAAPGKGRLKKGRRGGRNAH